MDIQVLVLGNDEFAKKLQTEASLEDFSCAVDTELSNETHYDLCICTPDADLISQIRESHCGSRIMVFNGVRIANATLKELVKMRISGFLEDHNDVKGVIDALKRLANSKKTCARISEKLKMLCA